MVRPYNYSQLHDQDEVENKESPIQYRSPRAWYKSKATWILLISHIVAFVIGLVSSEYVVFALRQQVPSANTKSPESLPKAHAYQDINGTQVVGTQCGSSWQEAKAKGCRFDIMASRWYAPECFDQEVLDDMLAESQSNWNFTWYADQHHTEVVPPEKVLSGEFDKVYPDNLFHIKHCLHLWRRLHHAVITSRPVDEEILDYEHTLHCTKMIIKWTSPGYERHSVTSAKSGRPFCRSDPVGLLTRNRP